MEDKIFLLEKLEDDTISVVLEMYRELETKYETARAIVYSALDDTLSRNDFIAVVNSFTSARGEYNVICKLIDELYRFNRKDLLKIKKTLTNEEREVDQEIVKKLRKEYELTQMEFNDGFKDALTQ